MPIHPINACITREDPHYSQEDFLVIYTKGVTNAKTFVDAYLGAAEIMVNRLVENEMGPLQDQFALPLLNLYVNAIEFVLKFYIEETDKHRLKEYCRCYKKPPHDFKKHLSSTHDLSVLIKIIETMQPDEQLLHHLSELPSIAAFIESLVQFGIRSESTRYVNEKGGNHYPLYENQTYIYPAKLHESVKYVIEKILNNIQDKIFEVCDLKELSKSRRQELSTAQYVLNKHSAALLNSVVQIPRGENDQPSFFDADYMREWSLKQQELQAYLNQLNEWELSNICMALYFNSIPTTVENLKFFLEWDKNRLINKIAQKCHQVRESSQGLAQYLEFINTHRRKNGWS